MHKILIATSNKGKVAEFKALLAETGLIVCTPNDIGLEIEVEENGANYRENAGKKATEYSAASGLLCIADDSGLEVDALDGAPGLHSARFSPKPGATDADRRQMLLEKLAGAEKPWTAKFHATVAIGTPEGQLFFTEGDCPGEIIQTELGENGFGYDPIFLLPSLGRTMSELSMEEKNKLSHRAIAVRNAIPKLLHLAKIR